MRTAISNPTYRNAIGIDRARGNVTGTDALRKQLAGAFFPARHVVRHPRGVAACLAAQLRQSKQVSASAARTLEPTSSSMSGPQRSLRCGQRRSLRCGQPRWAAERGSPRAFVTSA
jgi:hypothetical protein